MQIDKINIVIDTDLRPLTRGLSTASKQVKSFQSEVEKLGNSIDRTFAKNETAFSRLSKAMQQTRNEASKGADFKTNADTGWADRLKGLFSSIRGEADRGATFKLSADSSGINGINQAINDARNNAQNGATFRIGSDSAGLGTLGAEIDAIRSKAENGAVFNIVADASGIEGVATQIDVIRSEAENGATFVVRSDTSGLASISSEIQGVRSEAENGAIFRVSGDTSGLAGVAAEIQAVRMDAANDATMHVNVDTSQLDSAGSSISGLSMKMADLGTAMALVSTPGLIAGLGAIPAVASAAAAAVGGLASALGSGLVGGAVAGGAALGGLGGAAGLVAAAFSPVVGRIGDYMKATDSSTSSSTAASGAANQYENALFSLETAEIGVADATEQAAERRSSAVDAYNQSLQRVQEAEQGVADAVEQASAREQTAIDQYQSSLDRVESAESSRDSALQKVESSTRSAASAQQDYNDALATEDERLARMNLDLSDLGLRQEQIANDIQKAQADMNDPSKTAQARADAALRYNQLLNDQQRNLLDTQDAQAKLDKAQIQGTDQLQGASDKYQSALDSQGQAVDAATLAEKNLQKAQNESGKAYDNISTAREQGAKGIEKAEQSLANAQAASSKAYEGIAKAEAEGAKQVAAAERQREQAARALDQAMQSQNSTTDKAAEKAAKLTAADWALVASLKNFKAVFDEAFGPAQDTLDYLAASVVDFGSQYLPAAGVAAENVAQALTRSWDTISQKIQEPIPSAAIQSIFDQIPGFVEPAVTAAGELGISLVTAFSRALPYGQQLIDYLAGAADAIYNFVNSAQGIETIDGIFATTVDRGKELWGVLVDLGAGVVNVFSAINASGIPDQMFGGLEFMAQKFRDVTSAGSESRDGIDKFLADTGPVLEAAGGLVSELSKQFFYMAGAVAAAINPDTGNSTLVDLINSVSNALGPVAEAFVATFEGLGPAIARNIGPVSEFFANFLGYSGALGNVLDLLGTAAQIFNGLPKPIQDAAMNLAALVTVFDLLGGKSLIQTAAYMSIFVANSMTIAKMSWTALAALPGILDAVTLGLAGISWASIGPLLAVAAIGAIAIDIAINFDTAAFASAYETARSDGESVGGAFGEGVIAGLANVPIVGPFVTWLDTNIAQPLDNFISSVSPSTSLWDVIMGKGSAEDNPILGSLAGIWESVTGWLAGLVPEISLMDIILFPIGVGEDIGGWIAEKLSLVWAGATEWLANLVPEISLIDVLMGAVEYGGDLVAAVLTPLQTAWAGITEWLATLIPEISLLDAVLGVVEYGGDIVTAILTPLQTAWAGATEWIAGLVPDVTLSDMLIGAAETVSTKLGEIEGAISDGMSTIYNDYIVYYLDAIGTYFSDTWDTIYNDYIVYYWDSISTYISDTFSSIYDDYIVYYLDSIDTYFSDTWSTIYNDYIVYYWDSISTYISDTFTTIYNDYIVYYLDSIGTYFSDTWSTIYNDYIVYYWDSISTYISDSMSTIYNDYIVYYWDLVSTTISDALSGIETSAQTTWDNIVTGVAGFSTSLYTAIHDGFWKAVQAGGNALSALLRAVSSALSTLGVGDSIQGSLTGAADSIDSAVAFADGGIAFANGGMGTSGKNTRVHLWNEQQGGEAFVAEKGPKGANRSYVEKAASWHGGQVSWDNSRSFADGGCAGGCGGSCGSCSEGFANGGIRGQSFAAGGIPVVAFAIGGGSNLGPEGLTGEAANIANDVMSQYGVWANTYTDYGAGTEGEHGSLHGNTHENTMDFWADSAFDPLDYDTGNSIYDYLFSNYGDELDTVIWQGELWNSTGYEEYTGDHFDHLHAGIFGSSMLDEAGNAITGAAKSVGKAACKAVKAPFQAAGKAAMAAADAAMGALPTSFMPEIGKYMVDKGGKAVIDWVTSQLPTCAGGVHAEKKATSGSEDTIGGVVQSTWSDDSEWEQAAAIAYRESNGYASVVSEAGATGLFQIMPSTAEGIGGDPGQLTDPMYNSQLAADLQDQMGWSPWDGGEPWEDFVGNEDTPITYHKGGVIPGQGNKLTVAQGGERVLSKSQTDSFDNLVETFARGGLSSPSINLSSNITEPGYTPTVQIQNTGKVRGSTKTPKSGARTTGGGASGGTSTSSSKVTSKSSSTSSGGMTVSGGGDDEGTIQDGSSSSSDRQTCDTCSKAASKVAAGSGAFSSRKAKRKEKRQAKKGTSLGMGSSSSSSFSGSSSSSGTTQSLDPKTLNFFGSPAEAIAGAVAGGSLDFLPPKPLVPGTDALSAAAQASGAIAGARKKHRGKKGKRGLQSMGTTGLSSSSSSSLSSSSGASNLSEALKGSGLFDFPFFVQIGSPTVGPYPMTSGAIITLSWLESFLEKHSGTKSSTKTTAGEKKACSACGGSSSSTSSDDGESDSGSGVSMSMNPSISGSGSSSVSSSSTTGSSTGGTTAKKTGSKKAKKGTSRQGTVTKTHSASTTPTSSQFAPLYQEGNTQNYRLGGLAEYHRGGVIGGPQGKSGLFMAKSGERVIPRDLNKGFEALAKSIPMMKASPRSHPDVSGGTQNIQVGDIHLHGVDHKDPKKAAKDFKDALHQELGKVSGARRQFGGRQSAGTI